MGTTLLSSFHALRVSLVTTVIVLPLTAMLDVGAYAQRGATAPPTVVQRRPLSAASPKTTAEIAAQATPAVVTIVTFDSDGKRVSQGSGFFVRSNGVLVTNWHVLAGASAATVVLRTGASFTRVGFLNGDQEKDVVFLKVSAVDMPTLEVSPSLPAVGAKVVTLGSPFGLANTVSEGIISAVREVNARQLVQVTAPISPGSSGGPILDEAGRVIAIATATIEGGQQINFGVPLRSEMMLLESGLAEKPLSEVFVASGRVPTALEVSSYEGARKYMAQSFRRAARPVSALSDVYVLVKALTRPDVDSLRFVDVKNGVLVVAEVVAGITVGLVQSGSSIFSSFWEMVAGPCPVHTMRTNERGDIAAAWCEVTLGGFQTDEGFWVKSDRLVNGDTLSFAAIRSPTPISIATGPYVIRSRTTYTTGRQTGVTTDWLGAAAIIADENAITVHLAMTNANGGTTEFYGSGPINSDGQFNLSEGGSRLEGSVRAGSLIANWTDARDSGRFVGPLEGERK